MYFRLRRKNYKREHNFGHAPLIENEMPNVFALDASARSRRQCNPVSEENQTLILDQKSI